MCVVAPPFFILRANVPVQLAEQSRPSVPNPSAPPTPCLLLTLPAPAPRDYLIRDAAAAAEKAKKAAAEKAKKERKEAEAKGLRWPLQKHTGSYVRTTRSGGGASQ